MANNLPFVVAQVLSFSSILGIHGRRRLFQIDETQNARSDVAL